MPDMPQVSWISWAEIEKHDDPYRTLPEDERRAHRVAIAQSIRDRRVWVSGEKHQSRELSFVPLVDGRWAYTWSMRAWGDLMASVWSIETGASYDYLDFYMAAPESPWGDPADVWEITEEGLANFERVMSERAERQIATARARLLEGSDTNYRTLWPVRASLAPAERVHALRLAVMPSRAAPSVAPPDERPAFHKLTAHQKNLAAAALAHYLRAHVGELSDAPDEREVRRSEDLYSILLVQRQLEEAKPTRKFAPAESQPDEREGE